MAGDNTIGWQDKQAYRAKLTIAKAAVKQVQRQEVKDTLQKKDEARQRARAIKLGQAVNGRPRWVKPTQVKKSKGDAANAEDAKARAELRRALEALDDEKPATQPVKTDPRPAWSVRAPEKISADEMARRACLAAREHLVEVEAKAKVEWIDPRPKDTGPRWVPPTKVIQLRGDAALAADAKARADHRRALEKAEASTRRPRIERYEPYPEAEPPVPQKSPWRKTGPGKQLRCDMISGSYKREAEHNQRLAAAEEAARQRICGELAFATGNPPLACARRPAPPARTPRPTASGTRSRSSTRCSALQCKTWRRSTRRTRPSSSLPRERRPMPPSRARCTSRASPPSGRAARGCCACGSRCRGSRRGDAG